MIYSEKSEAKRCEQFILFLIQREEKKVHIDVTSSKEPSAVLRKHWRGDDREFVLEYQTMAESLLFQNSFRLGAQMMLAVFGDGR